MALIERAAFVNLVADKSFSRLFLLAANCDKIRTGIASAFLHPLFVLRFIHQITLTGFSQVKIENTFLWPTDVTDKVKNRNLTRKQCAYVGAFLIHSRVGEIVAKIATKSKTSDVIAERVITWVFRRFIAVPSRPRRTELRRIKFSQMIREFLRRTWFLSKILLYIGILRLYFSKNVRWSSWNLMKDEEWNIDRLL